MSGEEGQRGRQAGRQRQASSKQARLFEPRRVTTPTALPACPRLGTARSRSGARTSPTLPRYPSLRSSVGRVSLSMPLRRPRRSSVSRLSTRTPLAQSSSPLVWLRRPATPIATLRRTALRQAEPCRVEPSRAARHATSHAVRAVAQADALFRKRARSSPFFHAISAASFLHPEPRCDMLPLPSLPRPLLFLATALSVLSAGRLISSVRILVHRRRARRRRTFIISYTSPCQFRAVKVPSTRGRPHRNGMR